jgi:hypothetical protein
LFFSLFTRVSTGNDTGELILGCFTYATVNVKGYWEFTADRLDLITGSTSTNIATSINAILDTGTTAAIAAPSYYANIIFSILGATPGPGWVRER